MNRAMSVGLAALLAACGGTDITGPPEEVEFAAELNVDLAQMTQTASGLYLQDLVVGTGAEAVTGSTVRVHYSGWLPDGTLFDSSRQPGREPFEFEIGSPGIIAGWNEGVAGMLVGGTRKLVIPPRLGYGAQGAPPTIPGNVSLVFDIELLEIIVN
jgi:peptidylprolyl isomerase